MASKDERWRRGRRSRVVLSPRRWRQIREDTFRVSRMTVTKSPVTGESTKETVKTIAQGMPDVSAYLW
jgi:hypothetical protein